MPREGIFARVVRGGEIRMNDTIIIRPAVGAVENPTL